MNKNKIIVIAEAGGNHNGSIKNAFKLIDIAKRTGADYVKFQSFTADSLVSKNAPKARYQQKNVKKISHYEMIDNLSMSFEMHRRLFNYCNSKKIKFLSSVFSIKSLNTLKKFKIDYFKIPSGEITNLPLLIEVAKTKKPIILSTGMCNLKEVSTAVKILLQNGLNKKNLSILHCNTEYPSPYKDLNLKAIKVFNKRFKFATIGYSDHSEGIEASIAAVGMGAKIIEKHFTISKSLPGPDHKSSLNEKELKLLINSIRNVEKSLGVEKKIVSKSEKKNIMIARKSIYASDNIKKGEKFSRENLVCLRPFKGISPMKFNKLLKLRSNKNYKSGDLIKIKV